MVNWNEFEKLPGSEQNNFELLSRSLIRLHYGRYGQFAALANQPGVEFHLQLRENCALGSAGRWFGWQCRWYGLPSGKALGTTRRKKIEESLAMTVKVLPELSDWVLWTRHPLTKADQKWFYGLKTKMDLHLWTSADAETLLSGDAEILRRTYFGELLLTPTALAQQHEMSVAAIRKRWLAEVHQAVDAERTIRRMLGEAAAWDELLTVADRLLGAIAVMNEEPRIFAASLSNSTAPFINVAQTLAQNLQDVHRFLGSGDFELLRERLDARPQVVSRHIEAAPRQLRSARLACGLDATNALADMRLGIRLLGEVNDVLGTRLVGVIADAGGGKTQLAAQLTAMLPDRPAGILLHGRELHSGRKLDDLAKTICIQGNPVPSMESLLAALDAAGQRARRRLPVVIDGLNEAEDPRDWKAPLAGLDMLLQRFANVFVVCTVRTGARRPAEPQRGVHGWPLETPQETPGRSNFAKDALPDDIMQIEMPGFGGDTTEAIQRYFGHFRINPGDADIPTELLSHPLTLRIFCEVTNPDRKREVGIEAMPGSLTGLFERYLDRVIERIGELAPSKQRYYEHDIRSVLDVVGTMLWENKSRELSERGLRKEIGDDSRPWNESIVHMLEQEGVVLRIPGDNPGQQNVIPVYDALGGYLIANAILTKHGRVNIGSWLKDPVTIETLNGNATNCHPLALDIFRSLVGLLPRRLHRQQLWQFLDDPMRGVALRMASALEGRYLDAVTVTAIADLIRQTQPGSERIFGRLFSTHSAPAHPLNAEFLDSVLRSMPVGDRDLYWTEWIRKNHKWIVEHVQHLEKSWQKNLAVRTPSDRLRAKWIMWLLTTTSHNLRDRVTRTLYWFGRGDPAALFASVEAAAEINDPYVFERMLAAMYGVAMAAQCDPVNSAYRKTILPGHARRLFDLMFKKYASGRTTHVLTREYARCFIQLAKLHSPRAFLAEELDRIRPPYSQGGRIAWQIVDTEKEELHGPDSPFRLHFENYTLGRLAEGRGNYDFKHEGYRKIRAQVLWRVQDLGWTGEKFKRIDGQIENENERSQRMGDGEYNKIDRYGKKYSWIAYFELGGWLQDQGLLSGREDDGRTWDVDIDPSFPSPTPEHKLVSADLLGNPRTSLVEWISKGPVPDLMPYLRQSVIGMESGPWVALDGFVAQEDESRGRRLFAFARAFLVARNEAKDFIACLAKQQLGGRWLPEKPECHYTFTGEIPWCDTYPETGAVDLRFVIKERNVKVRRKRPVFFLDDQPIKLTRADLLALGIYHVRPEKEIGHSSLTEADLGRITCRNQFVEVEEIHQETRKFRTFIPVQNFGWEGRKIENIPVHGITLAKRLARSMGLVHLPQTHDLQTKDGIRATYGIAFRPEEYHQGERFFFIREDILRSLLRKHNWELVWAIWGERELSYKQIERARPDGDLADFSHANFQAVYRF